MILHRFAWEDRFGDEGIEQDAVYLLRPDSYVALADKSRSPDVLARYFAARSFSLPLASPV